VTCKGCEGPSGLLKTYTISVLVMMANLFVSVSLWGSQALGDALPH
jgi:hypothetical protein